jgi:hypothetical protein
VTENIKEDGLSDFQSESQPSAWRAQAGELPLRQPLGSRDHPPAPYVSRDAQYGHGWGISAVAIVLALAVAGVLFATLSRRPVGPRSVEVTEVEAPHARAAPETETESRSSLSVETPPTNGAAIGTSGPARGPAGTWPAVKRATALSRRPAGLPQAEHQRVSARTAAAQSRRGAQPATGTGSAMRRPATVSAPSAVIAAADTPPDAERSIPLVNARQSAGVETGTQVAAVVANSDRHDLTFRWNAPVGRFADATASQTRFFCPETPQRVEITVTVTDGSGATATQMIVVQCVAPARR